MNIIKELQKVGRNRTPISKMLTGDKKPTRTYDPVTALPLRDCFGERETVAGAQGKVDDRLSAAEKDNLNDRKTPDGNHSWENMTNPDVNSATSLASNTWYRIASLAWGGSGSALFHVYGETDSGFPIDISFRISIYNVGLIGLSPANFVLLNNTQYEGDYLIDYVRISRKSSDLAYVLIHTSSASETHNLSYRIIDNDGNDQFTAIDFTPGALSGWTDVDFDINNDEMPIAKCDVTADYVGLGNVVDPDVNEGEGINWVRIASCANGYNALADFIIKGDVTPSLGGSEKNGVQFIAGIKNAIPKETLFTLLSYYGTRITKIRFLTKIGSASYLEIYIYDASNSALKYWILNNAPYQSDGGWTAIDFSAGSIPSGYTDTEFDIGSTYLPETKAVVADKFDLNDNDMDDVNDGTTYVKTQNDYDDTEKNKVADAFLKSTDDLDDINAGTTNKHFTSDYQDIVDNLSDGYTGDGGAALFHENHLPEISEVNGLSDVHDYLDAGKTPDGNLYFPIIKKVAVAHDGGATQKILDVVDGIVVERVWLKVTETWDGTGVTFEIGVDSNHDSLITDLGDGGHNVLGGLGIKATRPCAGEIGADLFNRCAQIKHYTGSDTINLYLGNSGDPMTQGEAIVYIMYYQIS